MCTGGFKFPHYICVSWILDHDWLQTSCDVTNPAHRAHLSKSDFHWAQRNFPLSEDECENCLLVSNTACTFNLHTINFNKCSNRVYGIISMDIRKLQIFISVSIAPVSGTCEDLTVGGGLQNKGVRLLHAPLEIWVPGECKDNRSADFITSLAGFYFVSARTTRWIWNTAVALQSLCTADADDQDQDSNSKLHGFHFVSC